MTTVELPAVSGSGAEPAPPDQSQGRYRATMRAFRPRRTVPAAIVAALLTVGTLLVAGEVIARLFDRSLGALPVDTWARWGRETAWQDPLALALSALAAGLGLLLLALALWPGRGRVVPLTPPDGAEETVAAINRDGLARHVAAAATTVEGVDRAAAKVSRGRIRVRIATPLREPGDIAAQVRQAVGERLDRLEPVRPLPVEVSVRAREDGS